MEPHQAPDLTTIDKIKKTLRILSMLAMISGLALINNLFSIQKIECQNQTSVCSDQTMLKLEKIIGKSLFFTNLEEKLTEFEVKSIQRKLPNTLIVSLAENTQNYYKLVDQNLVQTDYESRDEQLTPLANELMNELQNANILPDKTEFISQVFIVYLTSRNEKYRALIDAHDQKTGVYRLKTVLEHVDIKGQVDVAIKEIDTRFKMPVLKTQFTSI